MGLGDKIHNAAEKLHGKGKESAGKATGDDKLKAEGTLVASQQLEPVAQARTLRTRQAQARITDGPFAETRELLAGFNLINASDHDEALRIAQGFPWSRYGSIEVRPVADFEAERRRVGA